MKIRIFLALAFFIVAGIVFYLGAQWKNREGVFSKSAQDHTTTDSLSTASISKLVSEGVSDVEVIYSDREQVLIAYDSSYTVNNSEVEGNQLSLRFGMEDDGFFSFSSRSHPSIRVYTRTLDTLINRGTGRLFTKDTFALQNVYLVNEGVGSLEYQVKVNTLVAKNRGVGSLDLAGTANVAEVDNRGVGSIDAKGLKAKKVTASNNGIGSVSVYGVDSLSLYNNGLGSVKYDGPGTVYQQKNDGIGSISN